MIESFTAAHKLYNTILDIKIQIVQLCNSHTKDLHNNHYHLRQFLKSLLLRQQNYDNKIMSLLMLR